MRRLAALWFSKTKQSLTPLFPCLTLHCGAYIVRRDFEGRERSFRARFRAVRMATSDDKEGAARKASSSLDEFSDRLDAVRAENEPEEPRGGSGAAWGKALRASSDLLAGLIVGMVIGYLLDRWLGTSPWLILVGIGVGFAAGLRNLARSMK